MTDSVPTFFSGISQIEHGRDSEPTTYWLYVEVLSCGQAKCLRDIRENVGMGPVI